MNKQRQLQHSNSQQKIKNKYKNNSSRPSTQRNDDQHSAHTPNYTQTTELRNSFSVLNPHFIFPFRPMLYELTFFLLFMDDGGKRRTRVMVMMMMT
mmetsp:Transcript_4609/g.8197  ORF Transcript_4609/g.8197 Transcript_4609/m.8197 type:complete len:96 (+) Transcript_4609:123-410(+)